MSTKQERLVHANAVIQTMASYGRRFFYNAMDDRVARLVIGPSGHVWLIDDYSLKRIYIYRGGCWPGFSHGGTLRSIIEDLRDYVRHGKPVGRGRFGPWRDGYEMWGYAPADMQKVRNEVFQNPAVAQPNIGRDKNNALTEFYNRWHLEADWMVCQGCKRPIIASRDGELLSHAEGCRNSDAQHPWTELRTLITPKEQT